VSRTESAAAWSEVAAGWERRDPWVSAGVGPVTAMLLERLAPRPGDRVLELGGGMGETGRAVAERVGADGSVLITDQSEAMVEAAGRRSAGLANVSLRAADAQSTGLDAGSFDGVVGRFVLLLAPEPAAVLAEAHRLLRPGGRLALAVWGPAPANPWGSTIGRTMVELGLAEPPAPDTPGPFRLADAERVRALVTGAGFEKPTVDDVPITMRYASFDEFWDVTRDLAMSLRNALDAISDEQAAELRARVEAALEPFAGEAGPALPGLARVVAAARP
jgi:SAM-dependent methyltransferase